jgi:oligopeptide/dipeptide ABC transporter ATP-binding protein
MSELLLRIKNLSVRYDNSENHAVNDFSFDMYKYECVAIVGESGSGKSTSALTIAGLLPRGAEVVSDSLIFQEKSLLSLSKREWREVRKQQMAIIFQDPIASWNPSKTISRQIFGGLSMKKQAKLKPILLDIMSKIGINDPGRCYNSFPYMLSGGMLQRAMIAGALLQKPDLIIADEPTSALDVTVQAELMQLLLRLKNQKDSAILLITHNLGIISQIADRVIVMYGGNLVETGETKSIIDNPRHPYTQNLMRSIISMQQKRKAPLLVNPLVTSKSQGCVYSGSCLYAKDVCHEIRPALKVQGLNAVACHFTSEIPIFSRSE